MAKNMLDEDVEQLFTLHEQCFQSHPRFAPVMKRGVKESKPFDVDPLKLMFKGKLIFPY